MPNDVEAGRLEVEVVGDTTGLARELQRKIDRAVAGVRAVVGLSIDARGARREVDRAVRAASTGQVVEVRARVAGERLRSELGRFVSDAEARTRAAQVGVDVDGRRVRGDVARLVHELEAEHTIDLPVDADTTRARGPIRRLRAEEEHNPIKVPVEADTKGGLGKVGAGGKLGDLIGNLKVPAAAAGINLVTAAASSLAAGAVALVGSLSPVVGVLGAVPGVAIAAGAGLLGVKLATSGLGDAVKELAAQERGGEASRAASVATARAQEAAEDRVRRARQALADATRAAADRQVSAARAVAAAERTVAAAQRAAAEATADVNRARKEARERLEDLRLELSGAALDERSAQLALEDARKAQEDANRSVTATDLDRERAALAVSEAEQRLAEVQERNADLAAESADANKKGVEGSDGVVSAKQRERDAQQSLTDAVQSLGDAQRDQARASQDSARAVADAQRDIAAALRDLGDVGAGKVDKVAAALDKLSPAGRSFARVLVGYLPLLDRLRAKAAERLFPPLEEGLRRLVGLAPVVEDAVGGAAGALGDLGLRFAELVSSKPFATDLARILGQNGQIIGGFGDVALALLDTLRHVAIAAQPLVERLTGGAGGLAEKVRDAAKAGRESGALTRFFERAADTGAQLLRIIRNLVGGLVGVGKAGDDLGTSLLDRLEVLTKRFADFTNSIGGQNRLRKYFEDVQPVLDATGRLVADIFKGLASRASSSQLAPLIDQVRTELLPAILDLADTASRRLAPTLVDLLTAFVRLKAEIPLDPFIAMLGALADLTGVVAALLRNVPGLSTAVGLFVALATTSKALQFAGKATGITSFVNALSGKGNGALSNFVRGLRGADGAADTLAGRLGKRVAPMLSKVGGALSKAASSSGDLVKSLGRQAAAWAVQAAKVVWSTTVMLAQKAAAVVTAVASHALTAAQWLLNIAMSANPVMLVVLAIVALVAIFVIAWRHSETFRNIVKGALGAVLGAAQAVFGWIKRNWPLLLAILTGPFGFAVLAIVKNWDKVKAAAGAVKDFIVKVWNGLKAALGAVGEAMKAAITRPFDAVKSIVKGAINFVLSGLRTMLRAIGKIKIGIPKVHVPGTNIDVGGGEIGLPDLSGLVPPNLARGGIIRPRRGGTLVNVAEAGKPEIVGPLDEVARLLAGPRVVFEAGAIVVHNPAPEPASWSINARMRALEHLGVFGVEPAGAGA